MDLLKILDGPDLWNLLSGNFMEVLSKYLMAAAIPVLIIALINCFFGHKAFRILVGIAGIILGGGIGVGAVTGISLFMSSKMPSVGMMIISAIVGAVVIGFASFKLYKAGAFFMGFVTGVILGVVAMKMINQDEYVIAGVIGGLLMGLLAIDLYRHVVILLTAINGGIVSAACLSVLLSQDDPSFILKVGIFFSVAGVIAQYIQLYMARKNAAEEDEEEEDEYEEDRREKKKKRAANKKESKKDSQKKKEKISAKQRKNSKKKSDKKKYDKKKYNYEDDFFLVAIFTSIAQQVKDFIVEKTGMAEYDEYDEEEGDYDEEREDEEEEDYENEIDEKTEKQVRKPDYIIREEEELPKVSSVPKIVPEVRQRAEEITVPVFDLDDIGHKLEEKLEHSIEEEKDKELEDLIIKEAYRNLK
ncbi:ABC-2 transporter permease [Konateibacter massiliensis]|uniref:DUF4203 domain-containing protein n=1 Tax=Konateibacter massiliensis TaxID=2002841 RepID=UPI000C15D680|nr:DUF4203 domain-containing protein [Konateibacter massiliensis]